MNFRILPGRAWAVFPNCNFFTNPICNTGYSKHVAIWQNKPLSTKWNLLPSYWLPVGGKFKIDNSNWSSVVGFYTCGLKNFFWDYWHESFFLHARQGEK